MGIKKFIKDVVHEGKVLLGEDSKDKTYSSENSFTDAVTAKQYFESSKEKLFNVDQWSDLPGLTSEFQLYDTNGKRLKNGTVKVNCFIRIQIPAPYPESWVKVTDVYTDNNRAEFTVSPGRDPIDKDDKIEHFFIKEATSTFKVELHGQTIQAFEIGKNEAINNDEKEAGDRVLLNTFAAMAGWVAFQKIQWKKLTDYLVHKLELER